MASQIQPREELYPLSPCVPSDIPACYSIYCKAFGPAPTNDIIFPPTLVDPVAKQSWFSQRMAGQMEQPDLHFYKITDTSTGETVAWQRWGFPCKKATGANPFSAAQLTPLDRNADETQGTDHQARDGKKTENTNLSATNGNEVKESNHDKGNEEDDVGWPQGTNLAFVDAHYGMLDRWRSKYIDWEETYGIASSPSHSTAEI